MWLSVKTFLILLLITVIVAAFIGVYLLNNLLSASALEKSDFDLVQNGLDESEVISDLEKKQIDLWLKDAKLNQYGESINSSKSYNSSLSKQNGFQDKYSYLIKKFPEKPWQNQKINQSSLDLNH